MGLSGVSRVRCPVGDWQPWPEWAHDAHNSVTRRCFRTIPVDRKTFERERRGAAPATEAQTVENLLNGVGRVDRCHDFHTSPAARAFEDVQFPYSFHEFGPCVIPAVPTGSRLQCFLCSCCRSRRSDTIASATFWTQDDC